MSLRATNSSSSQRYKDKLLALEVDPDIEMFTTQKRSSTSQVTANKKKAKGKSNSGLKRPPFWLGFQALNWTNRGKCLPMDSHLPDVRENRRGEFRKGTEYEITNIQKKRKTYLLGLWHLHRSKLNG
jgi:hypothetical protein